MKNLLPAVCVCVYRCNILPDDSVDEKRSGQDVAVERCNV